MGHQIVAKRACLVDEAVVPELKRWKPSTDLEWNLVEPGVGVPASAAEKLPGEAANASKLEVDQEPTSVLDLQTSPGRSCSSSSLGGSALSSHPSLSSEETSVLELGSHVVTDESVHNDHDIASWMEYMEDGLTPSDFAVKGPGVHQSAGDEVTKLVEGIGHFVNADTDFGFELGAFDMLADPGLCLIDHFPEEFELDDSLSSMMDSQEATVVKSGSEVVVPSDSAPLDSGLQLVHLLLACAEAIDESDFDTARPMLSRLKAISNPYGDPMQRIALYFADALSDRLESRPVEAVLPSEIDKQLAFQSFYEVLPFSKFTYLTANQAIFEAVGYRDKIHVIDLDIQQGLQWPSFLQTLAMRPGGPPHLHLTAVGTNASSLELTQRRLTEFARALQVPFEFTIIQEPLENLDSENLPLVTDATLAVNCSHVLHSLSGVALEKLLSFVRRLHPEVVTVLEVEANHNGENLLSRFVEALHYYCALFDALEGSLPRDSPDRYLIENTTCFGEIRGIVAREGGHAVKSESWHKLMTKCGFTSQALSAYAVQQAQLLLAYFVAGDGSPYKLSEDRGALIMGWQDTPVMAVSSWRC